MCDPMPCCFLLPLRENSLLQTVIGVISQVFFTYILFLYIVHFFKIIISFIPIDSCNEL